MVGKRRHFVGEVLANGTKTAPIEVSEKDCPVHGSDGHEQAAKGRAMSKTSEAFRRGYERVYAAQASADKATIN